MPVVRSMEIFGFDLQSAETAVLLIPVALFAACRTDSRLILGRNQVLLNDRSHYPWVATFLIGTGAASGVFVWQGMGQPHWPGGSSTLGLTYGGIAAALFIFEFLIWPRKSVRSWRLFGSAALWMRAHIWLGLLCIPLVALHSGLRFGGWLTTFLVVNFAVVIVSGIAGLLIQQWLPKLLTEVVAEETIHSQIDAVMRSHALETARLIDDVCGLPTKNVKTAVESLDASLRTEEGPLYRRETIQRTGRVRGTVVHTRPAVTRVVGAEELRTFFRDLAIEYLQHGSDGKSPLNSTTRCDDFFRDLKDKLPAGALPVVEILESQCSRRRQLDRQARLHFWLHSWLWVHVPLSVGLLVLTTVHAIAAWRY